jgi:hypothetical protein
MKKLFIFLSLATLVACQKETLTSASTSVDSNARFQGSESFPMEFLAYDSCTAEWVVVGVVLEYKYNYFTTQDDFYGIACYSYKGGHGVGVTTGTEYRVKGRTATFERIMDYPDPTAHVVRVRSKLTFATKGADWIVEGSYKMVSKDGEVTTLVETENSYCK